MIRDPSTSDLCGLCDWAELLAIASPRKLASRGDIIKFIQPDDLLPDETAELIGSESEDDESLANDVIGLALRRSVLLGKAYPFTVTEAGVKFRDSVSRTHGSAYLFYLMFCALDPTEVGPEARHYFETESMAIVHGFFGGYAFHFGWTKLNARLGKIKKRVDEFCNIAQIGWKPRDPLLVPKSSNDIEIDAIVWNVSDDSRGNAFVVLTQCATGHNWDQKLASSAKAHLEDCFEAPRDGPWINSFCTPFEIPVDRWRHSARSHDGYIFDRLRLVLESDLGNGARYGRLQQQESLRWLAGVQQRLAESDYGSVVIA